MTSPADTPPPDAAAGMTPAEGGGTPPGGPRGPLGLLTRDWPLKAFALVLAFMIWVVVREQITTTLTVTDVPVEIEIREGYVVVATNTDRVDVALHGTWGDVAPARAALAAGKVRLRLTNIEGNSSGTAPQANAADYTFPFEQANVVASVTPPVSVEWSRVAERTVPVDPPARWGIPAEASIEAPASGVTLDTASVRVRGPVAVVNDALKGLALDLIPVGPWWAAHPDLSTPMSWEAGFETWRGEGPDAKLRAPRLLTIVPERVTGKAKFRQTGSRALAHPLQPIPPAGGPAVLEAFEYSIERSKEYDPRTQTLQVNVKGDNKALDFLERSPDDWSYLVELPPPPEAGAAPIENKEVPVFLFLKKSGYAVSLDGKPTVFVTVKPRPK